MMKTSRGFSLATVLIAAISLLPAGWALGEPAAGQNSAPDMQKKSLEDFSRARDQRSKLLRDIPPLKDAIEALRRQKANNLQLQSDKSAIDQEIARAEDDLKLAQKEVDAATDTNEKRNAQLHVRSIQQYLAGSKNRSKFLENTLRETSVETRKVDDDLTKKEAELAKHQADLEVTEQRISEHLNVEKPRQTFKLIMSAVFASLVFGVIVGFFLIAFKDERVRLAIFSGTAGIQFVTLFSLVIAIILFGIIDILEAKELSALLGGLSGYILGRATSERSTGPAPSIQQGGGQQGQPHPQGDLEKVTR